MKLKLRPLDTQVVVITGATSGIGLVTARRAAAKRARLVLASRNEGALRFLADEINAAGGEAVHAVADVANEEDVRRIAATARQRFGGFDTWVNNAGVSTYGNLTDISLADHRRLLETNYWGVVHGSLVAAGAYKGGGFCGGHVAESSLYTKASLHPLIAGGLLLAGAGLAYFAFRGREPNGHYDPNQLLAQRTN